MATSVITRALTKIAEIDATGRRNMRASRIAMGAIWYDIKDDPALINVPLTDLAPLLKRDRTYLQKCLNLREWERSGLLATMETALADFEPQSRAEPYYSTEMHAEYQRRTKAQNHSATTRWETNPTARMPRDPIESDTVAPPPPLTTFITGDCRAELPKLGADSVDMLITSVPYHGKRHYLEGHPKALQAMEIGHEPSVADYLAALVGVFRLARRVLKSSGSVWIVIDDRSSAGRWPGVRRSTDFSRARLTLAARIPDQDVPKGDLMLIPERLAVALSDDGWHLREKIIWDKSGGKAPGSIARRLDHAYEIILVMTKSTDYFWNERSKTPVLTAPSPRPYQIERDIDVAARTMKKPSDVWSFPLATGQAQHSARFPEALVARALRLGCPPAGHVLDCFAGCGTTARAANKLGHTCTLIELNPAFVAEAQAAIAAVAAPTPRLPPMVTSHGTLIHGDCLDELRKLPTGSIGMILADPPFGNEVTRLPWDEDLDWLELWEQMWRVIRIDGSIVLNCNVRLLADLVTMQRRLYRTTWHWWRPRFTNPMQAASQPRRHIEHVVVFNRVAKAYNPQMTERAKPFNKIPRPIAAKILGGKIKLRGGKSEADDADKWISQQLPDDLLFPAWEVGEKLRFATQKPIALGVYLIKSYSRPADTILDFCAGAGSYLVSAHRTGHRFIGIEQDEQHFRIACERIGRLIPTSDRTAAD